MEKEGAVVGGEAVVGDGVGEVGTGVNVGNVGVVVVWIIVGDGIGIDVPEGVVEVTVGVFVPPASGVREGEVPCMVDVTWDVGLSTPAAVSVVVGVKSIPSVGDGKRVSVTTRVEVLLAVTSGVGGSCAIGAKVGRSVSFVAEHATNIKDNPSKTRYFLIKHYLQVPSL